MSSTGATTCPRCLGAEVEYEVDRENDAIILTPCVECEAARLRAWKAEAILVLAEWEQVWEALGCPGRLGESKAMAVLRVVGEDHGSREQG